MKKTLLIAILCVLIPSLVLAKKVKKEEVAVEEQPAAEQVEETVVTEECLMNVSLFNESCKNKQYAEAYEPWLSVFNTCPNANKVIYTKGADILGWKIEQTTDPAERKALVDLLMQMYDKRIKYFGDDPKYPVHYILGLKGVDYCNYCTDDALKLPAYEWLKTAIEKLGSSAQLTMIQKFNEVSSNLYKSDPSKYAEQYISDYQKMSDVLTAISNDANNKYANTAKEVKSFVDETFVSSGVADCKKLDEVYAPMVKQYANDVDMLGKIMYIFRKVGCTESEIYFSAAATSHKLKPTSESAAGCGKMCIKKGEYNNAVKYYEEAIKLTPAEAKEDIADDYYMIAYIYYEYLKNYSLSRQNLKKSLEYLPDQGRCYLMMGILYASSEPYGSDVPAAKAAILNKTRFWVAVDKFIKAKSVDASVAETANKFIAEYSRYFPTKEEMFDLPNEFKGNTFTVGGWIGETTTIRPAK